MASYHDHRKRGYDDDADYVPPRYGASAEDRVIAPYGGAAASQDRPDKRARHESSMDSDKTVSRRDAVLAFIASRGRRTATHAAIIRDAETRVCQDLWDAYYPHTEVVEFFFNFFVDLRIWLDAGGPRDQFPNDKTNDVSRKLSRVYKSFLGPEPRGQATPDRASSWSGKEWRSFNWDPAKTGYADDETKYLIPRSKVCEVPITETMMVKCVDLWTLKEAARLLNSKYEYIWIRLTHGRLKDPGRSRAWRLKLWIADDIPPRVKLTTHLDDQLDIVWKILFGFWHHLGQVDNPSLITFVEKEMKLPCNILPPVKDKPSPARAKQSSPSHLRGAVDSPSPAAAESSTPERRHTTTAMEPIKVEEDHVAPQAFIDDAAPEADLDQDTRSHFSDLQFLPASKDHEAADNINMSQEIATANGATEPRDVNDNRDRSEVDEQSRHGDADAVEVIQKEVTQLCHYATKFRKMTQDDVSQAIVDFAIDNAKSLKKTPAEIFVEASIVRARLASSANPTETVSMPVADVLERLLRS